MKEPWTLHEIVVLSFFPLALRRIRRSTQEENTLIPEMASFFISRSVGFCVVHFAFPSLFCNEILIGIVKDIIRRGAGKSIREKLHLYKTML